LLYVAGAVGSLYLHNAAVFLVATCGVVGLVVVGGVPGRRWAALANLALSHVCILAAWSFWIEHLLKQTKKVVERFWPVFPTRRMIWLELKDLYLYDVWTSQWVQWLIVALALLGVVVLRRRPAVVVGLLLLAILPPVLVLLVSLHTPMFMTRIMLWAPIPLFALCAAGANAISHNWCAVLVAVALAIASASELQLHYFTDAGKPPWREVARVLSERHTEQNLVIAARSQDVTCLNYYTGRHSKPIGSFPIAIYRARGVDQLLRSVRTVWLVDQTGGRKSAVQRAALGHLGALSRSEVLGGIALFKFHVSTGD
jgi:hypothetical protein